MRFVSGAFLGSTIATVLLISAGKAWVHPSVDTYPEFRLACQGKFQAEQEAGIYKRQLMATQIELDALRRKGGNPVNPKGVVVKDEDRIPAPKEPLPVAPVPAPAPANPNGNTHDDDGQLLFSQPNNGGYSVSQGFTKAVRSRRKLRAAFDGVSGSGKSFSSLRLAFSLVQAGMGSRIAVIDSESGSASLYASEAPDGIPWEYDCLDLTSFGPDQYTAAINLAFKSGYDILIIDSLSHAWNAEGGALDLVDKKGGNKFTAWKDVTPLHRRMVDAIINAPGHVIVTMRSKTEYVLEADERGKQVPRKIGMAPVQRDGMEYEFDVYGSIDTTQQIRITKSRCPAINGSTGVKPGPAFWQPLFDWLNSATASSASVYAEPPQPLTQEQLASIASAKAEYLKAKGTKTEDEAAVAWSEVLIPYGVGSAKKLNRQQAENLIGQLKTFVSQTAPTPTQATVATHAPAEPAIPVGEKESTVAVEQSPPVPVSGPITQPQLEELLKLKKLVMASKGVGTDKLKEKAEWEQILAPFGTASAKTLTTSQASELITTLGRQHDPFGHPASANGTSQT